MKYDKNKRIGKAGSEYELPNQYETDTNKSRRDLNVSDRERKQVNMGGNQYTRNDDLEQSTSSIKGGDGMYYYEPENMNRNKNSPVTEGRTAQNNNYGSRSPSHQQSIVKTVKNDLNEKNDLSKTPVQQFSIKIPQKKADNFESSPKTIYAGQENIFDLNTKTRDKRMTSNEHQGYIVDKSTDYGNPTGDDEIRTKNPNVMGNQGSGGLSYGNQGYGYGDGGMSSGQQGSNYGNGMSSGQQGSNIGGGNSYGKIGATGSRMSLAQGSNYGGGNLYGHQGSNDGGISLGHQGSNYGGGNLYGHQGSNDGGISLGHQNSNILDGGISLGHQGSNYGEGGISLGHQSSVGGKPYGQQGTLSGRPYGQQGNVSGKPYGQQGTVGGMGHGQQGSGVGGKSYGPLGYGGVPGTSYGNKGNDDDDNKKKSPNKSIGGGLNYGNQGDDEDDEDYRKRNPNVQLRGGVPYRNTGGDEDYRKRSPNKQMVGGIPYGNTGVDDEDYRKRNPNRQIGGGNSYGNSGDDDDEDFRKRNPNIQMEMQLGNSHLEDENRKRSPNIQMEVQLGNSRIDDDYRRRSPNIQMEMQLGNSRIEDDYRRRSPNIQMEVQFGNSQIEEDLKKKSSNIQIEMPLNTFSKNKMSPNRNQNSDQFIDRGDDEDLRRRDKREKIERLKNMQSLVYYNNDDETLSKKGEKIDYDQIYNNYGDDMKRLSQNIPVKKSGEGRVNRRKITGYNNIKNEGKLVNQNVQSMKASDGFNDRHTVLPNMNKLSTILLSRSVNPNDRSSMRTKEIEGANTLKEKELERKTFSAVTRTNQNKFIRLTMAMLSTKGKN